MTRGIGLVLVAGGAALLWLLKKRIGHRRMVQTRNVAIGPKNGVCGVTEQPANVTLKRNEPLLWKIRNDGSPCDGAVEVCIANWRPSNPMEVPGGGQFCRSVRPGQEKTLPARVKQNAALGKYYYEVWIDGHLGVDPMVQIVE